MARQGGLTGSLLAAALLLSGCGDTPMAAALLRAPIPPVAQLAPGTPVLRVSGGRRPFLFTLLQDSGGRQLWRAEGGAALAMDGGRITATAGLGAGLAATRLDGADPLDNPQALIGRTTRARRSLDLHGASQDAAELRFGVEISCEVGAEPEGPWLRVVEQCSGDDLAFTNRFWVEATSGAVRRSEQWVGDAVLTVEGP